MQTRIATCRQIYDGRTIEAGEEFMLSVVPGEDLDAHVKLLLALGRIQPRKGEPGYVSPKQREGRRSAAGIAA